MKTQKIGSFIGLKDKVQMKKFPTTYMSYEELTIEQRNAANIKIRVPKSPRVKKENSKIWLRSKIH